MVNVSLNLNDDLVVNYRIIIDNIQPMIIKGPTHIATWVSVCYKFVLYLHAIIDYM